MDLISVQFSLNDISSCQLLLSPRFRPSDRTLCLTLSTRIQSPETRLPSRCLQSGGSPQWGTGHSLNVSHWMSKRSKKDRLTRCVSTCTTGMERRCHSRGPDPPPPWQWPGHRSAGQCPDHHQDAGSGRRAAGHWSASVSWSPLTDVAHECCIAGCDPLVRQPHPHHAAYLTLTIISMRK